MANDSLWKMEGCWQGHFVAAKDLFSNTTKGVFYMHGAWQSPDMSPTNVHSQVSCIIT